MEPGLWAVLLRSRCLPPAKVHPALVVPIQHAVRVHQFWGQRIWAVIEMEITIK